MKCVRCDIEKPAGDFYAKDRTCKPCRRALVLKNRHEKADYYRAYDRERAKTPERMEHNRKVTKEWRDKNPRERACQVAVANAVRDGRLFKWPACAVPECDSTRPVAHHPDYDQPHRWGITDNPAARVPAHTVAQRGGTRHLSREEFRAVWFWLASEAGRSDLRACNAIRLLMATGQRVEEITGLAAGQYQEGWIRWANTKTGRQKQQEKPHSIPLPYQAAAIIDGMTPNRHGLYVPGVKLPDQPYPDRSLNWIARRCAKQLGIPQFTPRDLRRTWRSLAGDVGLSAEECARIMNHAYGSKVEADHYDRGENAAIKVAGMAKWEAALAEILA